MDKLCILGNSKTSNMPKEWIEMPPTWKKAETHNTIYLCHSMVHSKETSIWSANPSHDHLIKILKTWAMQNIMVLRWRWISRPRDDQDSFYSLSWHFQSQPLQQWSMQVLIFSALNYRELGLESLPSSTHRHDNQLQRWLGPEPPCNKPLLVLFAQEMLGQGCSAMTLEESQLQSILRPPLCPCRVASKVLARSPKTPEINPWRI